MEAYRPPRPTPMNLRFLARPAALLATLVLCLAPLLRAADPAALGFDPVRLQRLDQVIEREIAAGKLAGAVMIEQLPIATPVMAEAIAHFLSDALDAARMLARG